MYQRQHKILFADLSVEKIQEKRISCFGRNKRINLQSFMDMTFGHALVTRSRIVPFCFSKNSYRVVYKKTGTGKIMDNNLKKNNDSIDLLHICITYLYNYGHIENKVMIKK